MAVNLELYRIFYSVARAGSMTQASRELFISQPAVTQSIKQLEKELGGRLFIRGSRGITLTQEGELLVKYVERALDQLKSGERRFSEMLNLDRGQINIGASDSICKYYLLYYLDVFHEAYPNLEIHVTNRTTRETIQLLKNGEVDIGFVNLPIENDPQLTIIPCMTINDCFVAGPKYFDHVSKIKNLETLTNYPLLLLEKASNTRQKLDEYFKSRNILLKPAVELGSLDLLIEFSRIGLGIACITEQFILEELKNGVLRKVELDEQLPQRAIGLVHMNNVPISLAAERFMKIVLPTLPAE
ncbi:MAG: LysR family transcriptional regulator [Eubacteriales bacterium]|jgi:LysR family cyn operon transcriptional activator